MPALRISNELQLWKLCVRCVRIGHISRCCGVGTVGHQLQGMSKHVSVCPQHDTGQRLRESGVLETLGEDEPSIPL